MALCARDARESATQALKVLKYRSPEKRDQLFITL
jgi:hypothetical protein